MAKKTTAIKVMIVVFFTSFAVGQETRRISARTSRKNCVVRVINPGADTAARGWRPPRSPLPGGTVPRSVFLGGTPPGDAGA